MGRARKELYEEVLSDGRCNYRMPYLDPMTKKSKKLSVIMPKQSASNYKLALRLLQEKLDAIMIGSEDSDITFGQLCTIYKEAQAPFIKPSTMASRERQLNVLCRIIGKDSLIRSLTAPYIRKVLAEDSESNGKYNNRLSTLKVVLNWAYENEYLEDRKVIDRLKALPDNKKQRIEDKYLEKEELRKLLDATNGYYHYAIHFLALSGMRVGEFVVLKDSDIDNEYIHVTKAYMPDVKEISTPKTASSIRDIYMRDELKALVKEIRKYMKERQLREGFRTDLFLCGRNGRMLTQQAIDKYFLKVCPGVIGRKIGVHTLRHTAASLLIAEGVPLETVSRMLGHGDSRVTKDIYLHLTKSLRERDNELLRKVSIL